MVEVSPMTAHEWPWVQARSVETGWAQVSPHLRDLTAPETVAAQIQRMLHGSLSTPGAAVLVAREAGVPVGYIIVAVVPDELTGGPVGLFVDIWVEPAMRGHSVSSRLTAAGEDHCRSLGLRAVRRFIAAHNEASLRHARGDGAEVERVALIKRL